MSYIEAVELVGIAAFAVCGAMPAIDKGADVFGVLFLAVVTALGGGVIRDMMLGYLPPRMFTSYAYICVALVTAFIVFLDAYKRRDYYMVDHSVCGIAVYDLDKSVRSGTGMTYNYAVLKKKLPVTVIHPDHALRIDNNQQEHS